MNPCVTNVEVLPPTLSGYIWMVSGRHPAALVSLSIMVFMFSTAPLELQRRIVNGAIAKGLGETSKATGRTELSRLKFRTFESRDPHPAWL